MATPQREIYLDHAATTPCDPRVVAAMEPFWREQFGNASSAHAWGARADRAVERAGEEVALLIGAEPEQMVWTSGATEANALALLGVARWAKGRAVTRRKIVTSAIEHPSVLENVLALQREGFDVEMVPVDERGRVREEAMERALDEQVLVLSLQAANGEIGTVQDVPRWAACAHEAGALVHCDAAQAVGKVPVDVDSWGVDFLSISAHKMHGPLGAGALFCAYGSSSPLEPLWRGGGQQRGLRAGTLALPLIVGLGRAASLAREEMEADAARLHALRDEWEEVLRRELEEGGVVMSVNGDRERRLPHLSNVCLEGVEVETLLCRVGHLALSQGSACHSGALEPSPVLGAIGLGRDRAQSSFRMALGRFSDRKQVLEAACDVARAARELQAVAGRDG